MVSTRSSAPDLVPGAAGVQPTPAADSLLTRCEEVHLLQQFPASKSGPT